MEGFGDRSSENYSESIEEVECPFCHRTKITVSFIAGYMTWNVSSISAGSKRTPYFHDPKIKVHGKCPNCGASAQEIKDILKRGGKIETHEERLKRLKESGIPTSVTTPVRKGGD